VPGSTRVVTYTYASTITINLDTTDLALLETLTGNVVLAFVGGYDGQVCRARLTQDVVGGRLVTFAAPVKFSDTIPFFVASVAANKIDYIGVAYHAASARYHFISYNIGF